MSPDNALPRHSILSALPCRSRRPASRAGELGCLTAIAAVPSKSSLSSIVNNLRGNILGISALSFVLFGCASTDEIPPLQDHAFSEEFLFDGIRFYAGPWYAPGRSYAYQYSNGEMILSDSSGSGYLVRVVDVAKCEGLSNAYGDLVRSIGETVDYAIGKKPIPENEVIVMDGPTYTLQFSGGMTGTEIMLTGGGNAEHVVPWVSSAMLVREIASDCAERFDTAVN